MPGRLPIMRAPTLRRTEAAYRLPNPEFEFVSDFGASDTYEAILDLWFCLVPIGNQPPAYWGDWSVASFMVGGVARPLGSGHFPLPSAAKIANTSEALSARL
jgi:hypothetical protein